MAVGQVIVLDAGSNYRLDPDRTCHRNGRSSALNLRDTRHLARRGNGGHLVRLANLVDRPCYRGRSDAPGRGMCVRAQGYLLQRVEGSGSSAGCLEVGRHSPYSTDLGRDLTTQADRRVASREPQCHPRVVHTGESA